MPRLETLSEVQRKTALFFPCMEFESTPWVPMKKDLSQCKLALVTSAGLHLREDKPFVTDLEGGDPSYRVIPSSTKPSDILQSHVSIGFDHTGIYRDMNVAFPIDRVRELAQQGTIGSVAQNHYSFMGALRDPRRVVQQTGPEVAERLKEDGVDLVLLTPV